MDVFVHPGEHETFCQAVQEALASGVPVVAPDAGGPRDLVVPFRTGLLNPVDRFESLLCESVDHLITERPRYAQAARRSVLDRTWPAICARLVDHYRAVQRESGVLTAELRPA
jgi:phosphatidylinositol alpha 1,6-mannosyltransferase